MKLSQNAVTCLVRAIGVLLACQAATAAGQDTVRQLQLADRGPRFLTAPTDHSPPGDARDAQVLRRTVTLEIDRVPLGDVLDAITRQTGVQFALTEERGAANRRVSLHADNMSVAGALFELLLDTGLDVEVSRSGMVWLVPRGTTATRRRTEGTGTIAGRVTDAATHAPLDQAAVRVEGPGLGAVTAADGRYAIRNVPAGTYRVSARRVGYTPLTATIAVVTDSLTTTDFALAATATKLDEVVTTAVGDQRRVELGNAISTINTDSITKTAPITSLTDVLSGRAPGVEVLESGGIIGSPVRIRIRGLSSLQLSNNPIVYVDGVRINSDPGYNNPLVLYNYGGYLTGSRLNDLNPDEIQSIEVLKGPSAATEYGTDAANGVIVVKTKQGRAGAPRWNLNTEQGVSAVPVHFPAAWYAWGHTTDASHAPVQCPLTNGYGASSVGDKTCAVDSVTTYQPLDHAATSVLGNGHSQQYNVQVSGGAQQLRYFVAGAVSSQVGVVHLDPVDARAMLDSGISIPSYGRTPNVGNATSLRGRFTAPIAGTADLAISTAYISNYARGAPTGDIIQGAESGLGYRDPVYNGWFPLGPSYLPRDFFLNTASQGVSRFTGGLTATWRPTSWLAAHSTAAVDAGTENDLALRATPDPGFGEFTFYSGGVAPSFRGNERQTTDVYTADVGATATIPVNRIFTSKTSAGVQYNDSRQAGTTLLAYGISLNGSFNGAQVTVPGQIGDDAKTFGSYVEEMLGFNERLFVTGAVRVDAGSGFGKQVNSAVYPKASASWLLWDSPNQSLRLRAAYGASGVQPRAGSTLTLFAPSGAIVGGAPAIADTLVALGNPKLKPERQTEFEGGLDASVFNRRVDLELTYYTKLSRDALVTVTLPASVAARTEQKNIGSVRNYGLEGNLTLHVVDGPAVQWDVTGGGSVNTNRLVSLAPGVPPVEGATTTFQAQFRDVPGYAVNGLWAPELHFADANHDGIIEAAEVTVDNATSYVGPGLPRQEMTFSTSVGLWRGRVRVGAQVDHRGAFTIENYNFENNVDGTLSAPSLNNPHGPLWEQARAVAGQVIYSPLNSGYMENGTFTRWRELSVRYLFPDRLARMARARSAAITVSGRNLALWTHYTGPDPEATTIGVGGTLPLDASMDLSSFPLVRTWVVRVDVGL